MSQRLLRFLCLAIFGGQMFFGVLYVQGATRELKNGWQFRATSVTPQPEMSAWHGGQVPGSVQTDLLAAKLIPDPFQGINEARLQWIGLTDWQYRLVFKVSKEELVQEHLDLVFDGLDTFAEVTLNGQQVLTADNMFRQWRIPVKGKLRFGENELVVQFHSPITKMMPLVKALPYQLPTVSQVAAISEQGIATDPYTRKAPYNYGWDWGPRFVTEGIWKPVRLESWDGEKVTNFHVEQSKIDPKLAQLKAQVAVEADASGDWELVLHWQRIGAAGTGAGAETTLHRTVHVEKGQTQIELPFDIAHPALWNPVGYGEPNRYRFWLSLGGKATAEVKTGLRSLELRRETDQWGKSFTFVVNGQPVFAKGADTIPFDSFPNRVTPAIHRQILESAVEAHMNMVRSWGGGYYESDDFYEICDELGLMVWQEFMFGGAMVPGGAEFRENVRQEAVEQVMRLRDHPSLVLWCGNNELETGSLHWGGYQTFLKNLTPVQRDTVTRDYMLLFNDVLKSVVTLDGAGVPYWPSSPSANYDEPPDSDSNGDRHYWNVWHALAPINDYNTITPRFMSEYGFQSFPDMQTIGTFATAKDFDIDSPVMKAHQKNDGGNQRIRTYMLREYPEPKDFASFVYLSQVQQAEAIKVGAEHLRREMPRTMGSLYWQLNDCWPVASWASIDYQGHWKALQFYAKDFYRDVLVSPYRHDGKVEVYGVSDLPTPQALELRLRLEDFAGKTLWQKSQLVNVEPHSSRNLLTLEETELLRGASPANSVLVAELVQPKDGQSMARNLLYFDVFKSLKMPKPKLEATLTQDAIGYLLHVSTDVLARDVYASFGNHETKLSENYMTLLPGQAVTIRVTSTAKLEALRSSMRLISLADAF